MNLSLRGFYMKKNNIKTKTELQEIEEFLLKEGFHEVTKKSCARDVPGEAGEKNSRQENVCRKKSRNKAMNASLMNCSAPENSKYFHQDYPARRRLSPSMQAGYRARFCFSILFKNWPVYDSPAATMSSGVPSATMRPPSSPPSGPRSMIQSRGLDHVKVVLDHDHRIPLVHQGLEHVEELAGCRRNGGPSWARRGCRGSCPWPASTARARA